MMASAPLLDFATWVPILDGDEDARLTYEGHYSSKRSRARRRERGTRLFIGPGFKLLLSTPCRRAVFAWRLSRYRADGQAGAECTIFSNLGAGLSSELIRAADAIADVRWPGERHFTFVDPQEIASPNPGYCFKLAGWQFASRSSRGLHILDRPAR
jgi:hypothetical protein